ncbi:MAG: hypothetical protein ACFE85_05770 [Candidatus Hodarchaeota archaeon]
MHFLKKLIETPILDDPPNKHKEVHRHFYRYSKGDFIGPALKIIQTNTKITLKGTHEYEDLILEIVTKTIPDKTDFEIKGKLITGTDISKIISDLGFNWRLNKSTGKTKNYKADIVDKTNKEQLLKAIDIFRENSYLLLSFNLGSNCKVTTKKNIPQPSKKKIEDDDVNQRIQFCTGYIRNTEQNLNYIIDSVIPDFKIELPIKWKSIIILNNYKFTSIEIPKGLKDSKMMRIMAIRKGKVFRSIDIDGEIIEKQYAVVV